MQPIIPLSELQINSTAYRFEGSNYGATASFFLVHTEPGKGVALHILNRWDDAEAMFLSVLQAQPESEETLANLIALNVERFDLARVDRYAGQLLRLSSDSLIALQALTLVAVEQRRYEEASNYYFRWLESLPEGGVSAREDAIRYRLSREIVERLSEIREQKWHSNQARWAQAGD